jgi:hypothetical protein
MKKWKIILISFLGILGVSGLIIAYLLNKEPDLPTNLPAEITTTAKAINAAFSENETTSNKKYNDKIISVTGIVKEVLKDEKNTTITLDAEDGMNTVSCSFFSCSESDKKTFGKNCVLADQENEKAASLKIGQSVKIKGKCTGYLMLSGVVLNLCCFDNK